MEVRKVERKHRVSSYDIVRYQVLVEYVYFRREELIAIDLQLLTLLGMWGEKEMSKFCLEAVKYLYRDAIREDFLIKSQNIRNRLGKLIGRGLVARVGGKGGKIRLNGSVDIHKGNVLLNYNMLNYEPGQGE